MLHEESHGHHLSYHALKGTLTRGAIRFMRFINGIKIQTLTRFLRLHVHKAPQFKVVVRNGDHLECEGQVKHIPVNIQGHCLIVLAYFLSIVAVEIVLGTQWLGKLDTHLVNYNKCSSLFI